MYFFDEIKEGFFNDIRIEEIILDEENNELFNNSSVDLTKIEDFFSLIEEDRVTERVIDEDKYVIKTIVKDKIKVVQAINIRKNMEKTNRIIRNMDDEISAILNSIHDEIFIADMNGSLIFLNGGCERLYHKSIEEYIGKNVSEMEKELMFSPSVTSRVLKSKKKESVLQKTNTGKTLLATAVPIFSDGEISKIVTNSRDLTELFDLKRELEQKNKYIRFVDNKIKQMEIDSESTNKMIYTSSKMDDINVLINRVAESDIEIILTGESGVGKSMIAKHIHNLSSRKDGKFETINCSAIPENLLESELFGYEKGSFTGANIKGKKGIFEIVEGGTLFLDEIGELNVKLQAKLLRVLQEKKYRRIGGEREKKADFRLITATNQDLNEKIKLKEFRKDFYYRINGINIFIPPLRERKEDINVLIDSFLTEFNEKYATNKKMSKEAKAVLLNYTWEGNVRELKHAVERLVLISVNECIDLDDLPLEFKTDIKTSPIDYLIDMDESVSLEQALEYLENEMIVRAYEKYKNSYEVAKALKISQPTAYRKIKKYVVEEK